MPPPSPRRALLVCQAGPGVGEGHRTRVNVAAGALHRAGHWQVEVLACAPDEDIAPRVDDALALTPLPLVVLDLPPPAVTAALAASIARWRAGHTRVVGIDSLVTLRHALDGVFMPTFRIDPALAAREDDAPLLYGWDCFLLDEGCAPRPPTPIGNEPLRRALVLTGGSDATGLGRTWPTLLDDSLPSGAEVDWVTGPHAGRPRIPITPRIARFTEHVAPRGLGALMQACDIAVTVYGISLYELLRVGIPTVVFSPYGDKDDAELAALGALGVARVARDERDATQALAELMDAPHEAAAMSRRAQGQLQGSGASRFAAWIEGLCA